MVNKINRLLAGVLSVLLSVALSVSSGVCCAFAEQSLSQEKQEALALLQVSDPAYLAICQAIEQNQSRVSLSDYAMNENAFFKLMESVVYNNPQYFYLELSYSYGIDGKGVVTDLYLSYHYAGQALLEAKAEYEELMGALCALGSEEWSDLETVLFYHDYLAAHYQYDNDFQIYDAYQFLKTGEGVCQSYTLVFDAVMSYFNVPCTFAQSKNLNHIWNVVFVDGDWYYLDVTWDDPVLSNQSGDKPGSAYHNYFLLSGAEDQAAHFSSVAKDLVLGAPIKSSDKAHPYSNVWKKTTTPFVEAGGHFYGVIVTGEGQSLKARFAEVNFDKDAQITGYEDLPTYWFVAGSSTSAYFGNYSGLCTDGRYVYYSTDSAVYKYDSQSGTRSMVNATVDGTKTRIYALRFEEGKLVAYTCPTPNGPFTAVVLEASLPVYYTVTWVVDGEAFSFFVEEGSVPSFPGSTFKEGENGVSYQFLGWDMPVVPVYADVTYTALYAEIKEYVPGDCNGDGDVSISDVTVLLNYMADPENAQINLSAIDPNGDGSCTISDVTILLNYLAGHDITLN